MSDQSWIRRRSLSWVRVKSTGYHELVCDTYTHASVIPTGHGRWYANAGPDQVYRTVAEAKRAVEKALRVRLRRRSDE